MGGDDALIAQALILDGAQASRRRSDSTPSTSAVVFSCLNDKHGASCRRCVESCTVEHGLTRALPASCLPPPEEHEEELFALIGDPGAKNGACARA